jgi:predicted PurR-regulated permease PerM
VKRLAIVTAVVLATLVAVVVLWEFRVAAVLFFFSLGLAAALRPLIDSLARSGLPKRVGLAGTYAIGIAAIGGALYFVATLFIGEIHRASDDMVQVHERIAADWPSGTWFQRTVARRIPPPEEVYGALAGRQGRGVLEAVLGTFFDLMEFVVNVIVVIVLSIYWTLDRVHFERLWLSLLPSSWRATSRATWRAIESEVGAYFRSEVVQSLLAAVVLGVGYWALGIRYPTLLALVAGLAWMVPYVGSLIVMGALLLLTVPTIVLGGVAQAGMVAGAAGVYTLAVLLVLEFAIEPRLFNRRRYNALLMIVAVVVLADSFGVFGLLLGPPLAVAVQVLAERLMRQRIAPNSVAPAPAARTLEDRIGELNARLRSWDSPPPELTSLVARLEDLAAQSRKFLPDLPPLAAGERGA